MLQEIQLFVARGRPEVRTLHRERSLVATAPSAIFDEGDARFASEGRIGQHQVEVEHQDASAGCHLRQCYGFFAADSMKVQIHNAQSCRVVHNLPTAKSVAWSLRSLQLIPDSF